MMHDERLPERIREGLIKGEPWISFRFVFAADSEEAGVIADRDDIPDAPAIVNLIRQQKIRQLLQVMAPIAGNPSDEVDSLIHQFCLSVSKGRQVPICELLIMHYVDDAGMFQTGFCIVDMQEMPKPVFQYMETIMTAALNELQKMVEDEL